MLIFNVSRYHMTFEGYDFNRFLFDLKEVAILQPIIMTSAYFTVYVLIQEYLLPRKYILFSIYFSVSVIAFVFIFRLEYFYFFLKPQIPDTFDLTNEFFNFNFIQHAFYIYNSVAFFVLIKFVKQMYQNQEAKARLEQQNLKSELAMLRSQVNPHFLFNTLNNINSLAYIDTEKLTESVVKLSDIMRYMLFKTVADKVPLENEVNYIKNYIDLHQLRLKEENFTEFEVNRNLNGVLIAPLLLILPVENAFKHSRKDVKAPGIIMVLQVDNNTINFKVSNFKKPISKTNDKPAGTGLKNLERRLQLLYPGKHELIIDEDDQKYSIEIKIKLS